VFSERWSISEFCDVLLRPGIVEESVLDSATRGSGIDISLKGGEAL
jgi:hypothetical protein